MHIICAQKKDGIASALDFLAIYCFHDSVDYFREIPATLGSVEKSEVLTVSYSCSVIPPAAWYAILLCSAEIILHTLTLASVLSLFTEPNSPIITGIPLLRNTSSISVKSVVIEESILVYWSVPAVSSANEYGR